MPELVIYVRGIGAAHSSACLAPTHPESNRGDYQSDAQTFTGLACCRFGLRPFDMPELEIFVRGIGAVPPLRALLFNSQHYCLPDVAVVSRLFGGAVSSRFMVGLD